MKVNTNSWIPSNGISTSVDLANLKKKIFDYCLFKNILGAKIKNSETKKLFQKHALNILTLEW